MKRTLLVTALLAWSLAGLVLAPAAFAQPTELFDFETCTQYSSFPLDYTVNGLTAHFTGGYSIQAANVYGFTPVGFAGLCACPSSIYQSDMGITFSEALSDFSVLYAVDELACDNSATMRVTAYLNGVYAGTNTMVAQPGTYPTATLAISVPTGFNSVVVHWDHAGLGCQDYGPIFLADNITATRSNLAGVGGLPADAAAWLFPAAPTPFHGQTDLRFVLRAGGEARLAIYDGAGRLVRTLAHGTLAAGPHRFTWDGRDDAGRRMGTGLYHARLEAAGLRQARKLLFVE